MDIHYKDIGTIKTKKSRGHLVLLSSNIEVTTSAIAGAIVTGTGGFIAYH